MSINNAITVGSANTGINKVCGNVKRCLWEVDKFNVEIIVYSMFTHKPVSILTVGSSLSLPFKHDMISEGVDNIY